jgi:CheY-like chemotaxis protein
MSNTGWQSVRRERTLKRQFILLVDDDDTSRYWSAKVLRAAGARVLAVASAAEALEMMTIVRPHAIVAEIVMPGEDGLSFIARVRALDPERGGRTPALAYSAHDQYRARAISAGFQAFLRKSSEPLHLVSSLTALLAAPRGSSPVR